MQFVRSDLSPRVDELLDLRGEDAGGNAGLGQVGQHQVPVPALQRRSVHRCEANVVLLNKK